MLCFVNPLSFLCLVHPDLSTLVLAPGWRPAGEFCDHSTPQEKRALVGFHACGCFPVPRRGGVLYKSGLRLGQHPDSVEVLKGGGERGLSLSERAGVTQIVEILNLKVSEKFIGRVGMKYSTARACLRAVFDP